MRTPRYLFPLLLLLALAAPAVAQQPAVTALVDSAAALSPAALATLYRAAPPESAPATEHLFHGLVARRLFELSPGAEDVRRAAERSFDRARDRDPSLAWAHYGYGWALARGGELRIPVPGLRRIVTLASIGELVGVDATSRAQRAIRRALELDPTLEIAAVDLGRIALATRSANDAAEAATAIATVLQRAGGSPDSYLVLAELQLMRGETLLAAEAARAAAGLRADPPTQRVLALTLLADGTDVDNGAEHYLRALGQAASDTGMVAAYEADILPIVAPGELAEWRALPPAEREPWLRRFWERRAVESVVTIGERIAAHFRRLRYAHVNYQRMQDYGSRGGEAIVTRPVEGLPFDDRGMVYLRYGRPDTTVSSPANPDGLPPANETWVYFRPGEQPLAFNFFKTEGSTDWVIAETPRCYPFFFFFGEPNFDAQEPGRLRGKRATVEDFARYYEERAFIDPRHMRLVTECRNLVSNIRNFARNPPAEADSFQPFEMAAIDARRRHLEIERDVQRSVENALRSEDGTPKYDRPLPLLSSIYAFRGDGGTDVTAAVLIPSSDFSATARPGGAVYPLRLSLVLRDSASGAVATSHEIQRFASPETLPAGKYFRAMVHDEVAPFSRGEFRLRVENASDASEGQVQVGAQTVRSYGGSSLQISDLVVAEAEGGRWSRGAVQLSPIPTHQVETGRTFRLFYEIYNLPAATPYRTTLRVAPAEAQGAWDRIRGIFGRGRTIELAFDETAREPEGKFGVQEVRSIGAELAPGRYVITVAVTDLRTNATVERSAPLNVIEVQGR